MNQTINKLVKDCKDFTFESVYTRENVQAAKAAKSFTYLLSVDNDPKTSKSNKGGKYLTAIMFLKPGKTCPWASRGCLASCLNRAGNPVYMDGKLTARKSRTDMLTEQPTLFLALLIDEIEQFIRKCDKLGVTPAIRLNGTSDIPWEIIAPWLIRHYQHVQFYDYTKGFQRIGSVPTNYHLVLSRSESNDFEVGRALARGYQVTVVMPVSVANPVPNTWNGYAVDDGDQDDLTFTRKAPVIALKAKGPARRDQSGFVWNKLDTGRV